MDGGQVSLIAALLVESLTGAPYGEEMREMMDQSQVEVSLRAVSQHDLEIFFEQQLDPDATAMAGFPARDHDAHMAHWLKILADENNITRAILANGEVAGNIGSWIGDGERDIGYWIGKRFWGKGVATAGVKQFLKLVQERPLYAWVARHNLGSIRVLEKAGFGYDREEDDDVVYKIV